jgi:hypothetical protein
MSECDSARLECHSYKVEVAGSNPATRIKKQLLEG